MFLDQQWVGGHCKIRKLVTAIHDRTACGSVRRNPVDNISNHTEAEPISANPGLDTHPGRFYSSELRDNRPRNPHRPSRPLGIS